MKTKATEKPLSKTAQMKLDRANRVAARADAKKKEADRLAQLRIDDAEVIKKRLSGLVCGKP